MAICEMCGQREITVITKEHPDMCLSCVEEFHTDNQKIDEYIQQGHTEHCAYRLVWGDGECECGKMRNNS